MERVWEIGTRKMGGVRKGRRWRHLTRMGRKEGTGREGIKGGYRSENKGGVRERKGREENLSDKE